MKCLVIMCCLFMVAFGQLSAKDDEIAGYSNKPTAVVGFINRGNSKNDNLNIQMTKSMILYLSKFMSGVTPFPEIEKAAKPYFWKQKTLDVPAAILLAQTFGSRQVLTGEYDVDQQAGTLQVTVFLYDVVTGELRHKRSYQCETGIEMFDSIDQMFADVAGLMLNRKISFGKIQVTAGGRDGRYDYYLDGKKTATLLQGNPYISKVFADIEVIVSIRIPDGKEVLQKTVKVKPGETVRLHYAPSGKVVIKGPDAVLEAYVDGVYVGNTDESGELSIENVTSEKPVRVVIIRSGVTITDTTVRVPEGGVKIVYAGQNKDMTAMSLNFPIQVGMYDWMLNTAVKAGVDWKFFGGFRLLGSGGIIVYNLPNVGWGVVPIAEAGVGYRFEVTENLKLGMSLSAICFFGDTIGVTPVVNAELDYWILSVTAGVRFSPTTSKFYPVIFAGVKF